MKAEIRDTLIIAGLGLLGLVIYIMSSSAHA